MQQKTSIGELIKQKKAAVSFETIKSNVVREGKKKGINEESLQKLMGQH